jgi:hypothetical protein
MAPPIMAVPSEILQLILAHLGVGEVVSCSQTCGKWKSLLNNDWSFMERLDLSHYYKVSEDQTALSFNLNLIPTIWSVTLINYFYMTQYVVLHLFLILIRGLINFQTRAISRPSS